MKIQNGFTIFKLMMAILILPVQTLVRMKSFIGYCMSVGCWMRSNSSSDIGMYSNHNKSINGFTLIEALITIAMISIFASVAVPSFSGILKQNRLATQTNTIITSLNYARNETINQNNDVLIQPLTAGNDWSGGWTISANGTVLRNFEGMDNATLNNSAATITYQSDGTIAGTNIITLTLTPYDCPTGKDYIRTITIGLSGQSSSSYNNCP